MLGRIYDASLPIRLDESTGASNVSLELGREMSRSLPTIPSAHGACASATGAFFSRRIVPVCSSLVSSIGVTPTEVLPHRACAADGAIGFDGLAGGLKLLIRDQGDVCSR